jgi:hypothetical protein
MQSDAGSVMGYVPNTPFSRVYAGSLAMIEESQCFKYCLKIPLEHRIIEDDVYLVY